MSSPWTDMAAPQAWALIGVAWVSLGLARGRLARDLTRALLNLGLVGLLLGPMGLGLVALGLAIIYGAVALHVRHHPRARLVDGLVVALLLALFFSHKQAPLDPAASWLAHVSRAALEGVGFSYLALRALDLLRQLRMGLSPPPTPLDLVNYLLPFHMLTAGPIQPYAAYVAGAAAPPPQEDTTARLRRWIEGLERIASGMVKKFVVAGAISATLLTDFSTSGWALFVEMNAFYLWLYFDFSAYSDIAVGVGRLCGVPTPENFNRPLSARNLTVFWERWHISLSEWVRAHLYIPTQLRLARATHNRRPVLISAVAFSVAFSLCGLWHDVSTRFLLWGALHALGLSVCNAYRHLLVKRYGRKGVREGYMKRRVTRLAATALTFEFVAASLTFAFHPGLGL
ncbi:hypothetical protein KKF91_05440 [Myxococcota bacterium]|nr:hypothetical protein [Myxococcota bacterium]MBU1429992.1 hypothetical protein [Myxococcota bacterium]MBU1898847.1 hypothetical protein [Myxococcota bacterium]